MPDTQITPQSGPSSPSRSHSSAPSLAAEIRAGLIQFTALVMVGGGVVSGDVPWYWALGAIVTVAAPTSSVKDISKLVRHLVAR